MTHRNLFAAVCAVGAVAFSATAMAEDETPPGVDARQGQFQIMALNIGVLGNMARENTEYDAEQASIAASNLATMGMINQSFHWPEGTDNASIDGTIALPAIWENMPDFVAKWEAFGAAAQGLAEVAGDGLDPMRAALGPVGATCGDCHDTYRESQ